MIEATHLIDPEQARIATAAGFGSFVFLTLTRGLGWVYVVTLFVVGQITAFYFTMPIAEWRGWSMQTYAVIAFTIGALAMLAWEAVIKFAQTFRDDPAGTVTSVWRLWRGDPKQPPEKKG